MKFKKQSLEYKVNDGLMFFWLLPDTYTIGKNVPGLKNQELIRRKHKDNLNTS